MSRSAAPPRLPASSEHRESCPRTSRPSFDSSLSKTSWSWGLPFRLTMRRCWLVVVREVPPSRRFGRHPETLLRPTGAEGVGIGGGIARAPCPCPHPVFWHRHYSLQERRPHRLRYPALCVRLDADAAYFYFHRHRCRLRRCWLYLLKENDQSKTY